MSRWLPLGLLALLLLGAPRIAWAENPRIAVLYFENSGNPELEMLKLGLSQMMITDLSADGGLDVVERQRINELLAEQELQKTGAVDPATAVQLGKLLGAERLVLGAYFELMGTLRMDARVVDVQTGKVLGSVGAHGKRDDFMDLEADLVKQLRPHLGPRRSGERLRGGQDTPKAPQATPTPAPKAEEREATDPLGAALAFSEGLDYLDNKDLTRAKDALQRALVLDPSLEDARAELASIKI